MYCTNCGNKIDDDSNFCVFCGTEVKPLRSEIISLITPEVEAKEVGIIENLETKDISEGVLIKEKIPFNATYDETYERDFTPTFAGSVFLLIWLVTYIHNLNKVYDTYEEYSEAQSITTILNFFFRVIVTFWVQKIALFRNRSTALWGLFAFFFPAIALILIGLKKKLKPKFKL